jgi:hypothetical protein
VLIFAPLFNNKAIKFKSPYLQAQWRGVSPLFDKIQQEDRGMSIILTKSGTLTSARCSIKIEAILFWLFLAAK